MIERDFILQCVDYSLSELKKIDGFNELSDDAKTLSLVLASSTVVCKCFDKIFDSLKELIK